MNLRNALAHLRIGLLGALLAAALMACGLGASGNRSAGSIRPIYAYDPGAMTVIGTENFYADLLHQIGGSNLKIYTFLSDPAVDPHQYESSAADARVVADSRLVIQNGLGYDSFTDRLMAASPNSSRVVINVQKLIGAANGANPHVWYDPTVMPRVARAATSALAQLDPAHAETYATNLATFEASLKEVNDEIASLKHRHAGVPVAFTEPVFGYMSDAIGLRVKSPEEFMKAVEEGNDPPSRAVADEQDLITQHRVRVLIYNKQTVTKVTAAIRDLAVSNGVPVVGVSETEPPGTTLQKWQLSTLKELESALGK